MGLMGFIPQGIGLGCCHVGPPVAGPTPQTGAIAVLPRRWERWLERWRSVTATSPTTSEPPKLCVQARNDAWLITSPGHCNACCRPYHSGWQTHLAATAAARIAICRPRDRERRCRQGYAACPGNAARAAIRRAPLPSSMCPVRSSRLGHCRRGATS